MIYIWNENLSKIKFCFNEKSFLGDKEGGNTNYFFCK